MASAKAKSGKTKSPKGKAKSKSRAPARAARNKAAAKTARKPRKATARAAATDGAWRRFKNLADLRKAIDAMDDKLVPLLCRRLALVASAARFKPSVEGVVVQSRVEEIVTRVRAKAEKLGSAPDCMEALYRNLIALFTLEEQRNWSRLHRN